MTPRNNSAAIDKGNNALNPTSEDLGGLQRITDGDGESVAVIDMGAHEYPKAFRLYLPLIKR